jgi:amino acid adenylation domain-containing protein
MTDISKMIAGMSPSERRELLAKLLQQKTREPRRAPLSYAQERLWFLNELQPGSSVYNIPGNFVLPGVPNVAALEAAFDEIVRRHEVLRTTFKVVDWRPAQEIAPPEHRPLEVIDLRSLPEEERAARVQAIAGEEGMRPFDLARGPLMRVSLLRLADDQSLVLLALHHIISDGWSMSILFREIGLLYAAFSAGQRPNLPDLPMQYADYAQWQREWLQGETLQAQLAYWREHLAGAPAVLELPTDRPRPVVQSFKGASQAVSLPASLHRRLLELSHREGVTLFMTLLAAFQTLLLRISGQDRVVIGTPIAGRTRSEMEGLIGCFTNTLPMRTDLSGDPTFRELLSRVRTTALGAYRHQDLPFEKLVEELQPSRSLAHNPLFQVSFNLQNAATGALTVPSGGIPDEENSVDLSEPPPPPAVAAGGARFDLTVIMFESEHGLSGVFEYSTDLFDHDTIARMAGHLRMLLEGIADNPEARLSALPLLTPWERRQFAQWNDRDEPEPPQGCIHEVIEAQVRRTPDAPALRFHDQVLTYRELDERANQLARHLLALGVRLEEPVAVCVERSIEMIIAVLAVMKAGAAYVPLDATYPQERLQFMFNDSGARVLLTLARMGETIDVASEHTVRIDADADAIAAHETTAPDTGVAAHHLGYIIYTSGSTGRPKGVLVPHRGVVNSCKTLADWLELGPGQRMLQFASLSFDVSVHEYVPALMSGMTLCLATKDDLIPGPGLVDLIRDLEINVATLPPSVLAVLPYGELPALRLMQVAGEAFTSDLVARWCKGRRFFNAYGPTEASLWTAGSYLDGDQVPVIGKPIPNSKVHLLDPHLNEVPIGVPGELYISGVGVTRGYLGRPELTAERFVPDPFDEHRVGARMYRTGDVARWLRDGTIEYLGRVDHQVKLRGFRIELGEIEAVMAQFDGVRNAVAVVRNDGTGDARLQAYLDVRDPETFPLDALRRHVREKLPEYMLPAGYTLLEALPLTSNGKIDRAALPRPDAERPRLSGRYTPPRTPFERVLGGIWEEVLGIRSIGIEDNFFELGGHSLLVSQIISRVRDVFQVEVPMQRLFEAPTIAELAYGIARDDEERVRVEKMAGAFLKLETLESGATAAESGALGGRG